MGRKIILAAMALSGGAVLAAPVVADTKSGVDAWTRGDYPAAVKEWQAQASHSDGDAIFNLGQAYKLGKGVTQDLAKAEQLFSSAAAMGHLQAADNLGLLLFQRGERAASLPYLRAAADRGDPRAQYLLGIAHFNGDLVPKDWVRAYALVTLAQQQGLPQAAGALTQMNEFIPLDQRQQAVQLSAELASQADATRARQMAAIDLGSQVNPSAPAIPARGPSIALAGDAASRAQQVPGRSSPARSSPATAGADYARPAVTAALPPAPHAVTIRPAPSPAPAPSSAPSVRVKPAPAPTPALASTNGNWRIQLGAFGLAANADGLWAKLRTRPELAGHPRLNVAAGAATKLQAGGFSQAAAQAACAKLKAGGIACTAVPG